MALLNEYMWGSVYKEKTFSEKEAYDKLVSDLNNGMNTTFKVLSKNININVMNRGNTFTISTFESDNPSSSLMIDTYRKVKNPKDLANLVANYSVDKLEQFEKDEAYAMKLFINGMPEKDKDQLLYDMLWKLKLDEEKADSTQQNT